MRNRRVTNSPLSVQLLLTRKCNLNCYYCSAEQFNELEKEPELGTEEWSNLLKRLKEIQVFNLDLSGGEIFLRKDIFDILETAAACKFAKMSMNVNGTLIDQTTAKKLKSLNVKHVAVSLDGDQETHDQIRGGGSFTKTTEGIHRLIDSGIMPSILFTPLKINYKKLNDVVDMVYSLGVRELSFNSLHPTGRCSKIYKDIMLDFFVDSEEFQTIIDNIGKKYNDIRMTPPNTIHRSLPVQYHRSRLSSNDMRMNSLELKPCSAAHSSCCITSGGWVVPCSEMFDFKGGNIRDRDILDIWRNSENFEKIRNLSNITTSQIPYCRNCHYNVFCNAGCRADAYTVYGDLTAPDPFCPYWREK